MTATEAAAGSVSIPLYKPPANEEALGLIERSVRSGWLGYGPVCRDLEAAFTARGGWALAVQSCTAALWTVGSILRPSPGDEIIIPAITYAGCAAAFHKAGWRVVFADIDPSTGLIDIADAQRRVSPRTRALLVVDTYGQLGPIRRAREMCDAAGLTLVHDMAHRIDLDDLAAPLADFACYSFGPIKEAASPEGGLIWSSHFDYAEPARSATLVGLNVDTWSRTRNARYLDLSLSQDLGLKLRQNDICAAFTLCALPQLAKRTRARREVYGAYRDGLANCAVSLPIRAQGDSLLMIYTRVQKAQRDRLRIRLAERDIATSTHYMNLQSQLGWGEPCPQAEAFSKEVVNFPIYCDLSILEVVEVCSAINQAVSERGSIGQ